MVILPFKLQVKNYRRTNLKIHKTNKHDYKNTQMRSHIYVLKFLLTYQDLNLN